MNFHLTASHQVVLDIHRVNSAVSWGWNRQDKETAIKVLPCAVSNYRICQITVIRHCQGEVKKKSLQQLWRWEGESLIKQLFATDLISPLEKPTGSKGQEGESAEKDPGKSSHNGAAWVFKGFLGSCDEVRDGGLYYGNARTKPRIGVLEGGHEEGPVITIPTVLLGPSQASSGYRFSLEGFILLMSKVHYPQTLSFGYKKCAFKKATKHWKQWLLCHLLYQQRFLWRLIKFRFWTVEHQCSRGLGMEGLNLDIEE